MMLKRLLPMALALSISTPTLALDGAALFKERTCFTCHGKDAKTPIMPNYPKLAGQNAEYALQQMKDIKSGARNNGQTAAMKAVMHLVNDDEMKAIAEYLSKLK
ncbi:c-type cytochrome [Sulfuricystis multivorans]|uniref:c-type cytochrome n=1 Tax=Sulfuricystis multivorans TaxID=2211108 RepID=UPI0024DF76DA|nr:c-type cytochrome [Sulfuricystis multivorans]